jgi:hypothetical protein
MRFAVSGEWYVVCASPAEAFFDLRSFSEGGSGGRVCGVRAQTSHLIPLTSNRKPFLNQPQNLPQPVRIIQECSDPAASISVFHPFK